MKSSLKLIKNADIYAPEHLGINDILVGGEKIILIDKSIRIDGLYIETIDVEGNIVTPGFIDQHVHIIGGGGQQGYASLVPEVTVSELIACGTTTVVGLLGTDGFVKQLGTLYAKTKALDMEGLTAYMLTSYYGLPERTLTGSVAEDLIFIDKVIGCKLALSDDRCSFPQELEILRLINQVRLGGFTSGKGGILHIHLGNLPEGIEKLLDIAHEYPTLVSYLSPTHMIRTEALFEQGLEFARLGGRLDFSTGGTRFTLPRLAVMQALEKGVHIEQLTFSSDGHGGVKRTAPVTHVVTYRPAFFDLNWQETRLLVKECDLPLEKAICLITANPAQNLHLQTKGRLAPGYDADLCVLDKDILQLTDVMAKGEIMMKQQTILHKGRYEA